MTVIACSCVHRREDGVLKALQVLSKVRDGESGGNVARLATFALNCISGVQAACRLFLLSPQYVSHIYCTHGAFLVAKKSFDGLWLQGDPQALCETHAHASVW